jgi:hypothetical protein
MNTQPANYLLLAISLCILSCDYLDPVSGLWADSDAKIPGQGQTYKPGWIYPDSVAATDSLRQGRVVVYKFNARGGRYYSLHLAGPTSSLSRF